MLMLRDINKLSPIIRDEIVEHLKDHKISQVELAKMHNVHREIIKRIAKIESLCLGRGPIKFWQFEKMAPELAYVIGAYLTDGYAGDYQFVLSVKDEEFAARVAHCLCKIGVESQYKPLIVKDRFDPTIQREYFRTFAYCTMFTKWLMFICDNKNVIPELLHDASVVDKMSFVSAIIDGDGSVSTKGCICVNGCGNWLRQLAGLLGTIDIKYRDYYIRQITKGGKEYGQIGINRIDFLARGGKCIIPRKQARIEKTIRYFCPMCNKQTKLTKEAIQCQPCYFDRMRK